MSNYYPDLDLTSFPDEYDFFKFYKNITPEDGPYVKKYMEAMEIGDMQGAKEALSNISQASAKIIKAEDLNQMSQAIQAMERFYKSDIKGYVENKQEIWESVINQFSYMRDWKPATQYYKNNIVRYYNQGKKFIYIAITDSFDKSPENPRYWVNLTIEGAPGLSGAGLAYREEWKIGTQYLLNDVVTYNGTLWMATRTSINELPTAQSNAWKSIMALPTTIYPIQDAEPVGQEIGSLWFNTYDNATQFYYLRTLQQPATSAEVASGKEAYDENGNIIVGTGSVGNFIEWNSESDESFISWQ